MKLSASLLVFALVLSALLSSCLSEGTGRKNSAPYSILGNRFLPLNTVVRVNQIEVSRDKNTGEDESAIQTLDNARHFREAIAA
jgi:hypothetical protein